LVVNARHWLANMRSRRRFLDISGKTHFRSTILVQNLDIAGFLVKSPDINLGAESIPSHI